MVLKKVKLNHWIKESGKAFKTFKNKYNLYENKNKKI